jgi:hypothetical protein
MGTLMQEASQASMMATESALMALDRLHYSPPLFYKRTDQQEQVERQLLPPFPRLTFLFDFQQHILHPIVFCLPLRARRLFLDPIEYLYQHADCTSASQSVKSHDGRRESGSWD